MRDLKNKLLSEEDRPPVIELSDGSIDFGDEDVDYDNQEEYSNMYNELIKDSYREFKQNQDLD